jgi:hypothetical protein|nr:MAG TPA: adenylate kinase [Caudoviricetes sp.]
MAEYIERSAAVKAVLRERSPANSVAQNRKLSIIQRDLLTIPAADVAPVTRCKDCKYAYINSFAVSSGEALCTLSGKPMQQDDFCSYGEPKEG